jgi:type IV pilus assembly protein PilM
MLLSTTKSKAVVGLDVEAGSIAATEVKDGQVTRTGVLPLGPGVFHEGEVSDPEMLGETLKQLFADRKLSKTVRVGVANQRVAVRTLHLPLIEDRDELETAIRFQAQDHIPMPLEQAVLDWHVVDRSADDGERHMDVVAVAARRDMLSSVVESLRVAGLRPLGIDLSAFGMIRALAREAHEAIGISSVVSAPGQDVYEARILEHAREASDGTEVVAESFALEPAKLYCNLGDVTNLAVARGPACLFTRISPFGVEGIAQKLAERRQLTLEHARQWLVHVGLDRPIDSIEGDRENVVAAREALAEGAAKLVDELRLSIEFYAAQEGSVPIEGIVACGPGITVPGLADRLQRDLGQHLEVARPRALGHLPEGAAARLTVSYGLALEV